MSEFLKPHRIVLLAIAAALVAAADELEARP